MDSLLKYTRIQYGLKLQEISDSTGIDIALLSKYESGARIPPEKSLPVLSLTYKIPLEALKLEYAIAKIVLELKGFEEPMAVLKKAMSRVEEMKLEKSSLNSLNNKEIIKKTAKLEPKLKKWLQEAGKKAIKAEEIRKKLVVEYVVEAAYWLKINSPKEKITEFLNTGGVDGSLTFSQYLTLKNLKSLIEDISLGKLKNREFNLEFLKEIHKELYQKVEDEFAGKFRAADSEIQTHSLFDTPNSDFPDFKEIENFYFNNQKFNQPLLLAMEMVYKIVKMRPFSIGNERVAFVVFNFLLQKSGFPLIVFEGTALNFNTFREAIDSRPEENAKDKLFEWLLRQVSDTLRIMTAELKINDVHGA
jgi:fido (protein-threonine AMPylation protein)